MAMALVNKTTAPLEAQYTAALGPPARPQPDAVLMIEPPPAAAMMGITWRDIRKIDFTLAAITRSQSSSLSSTTEARRIMPALLNRMWMVPKSWTARSTTR